MTRHERRGAIVVLALIALLLAAICVMRYQRQADVPTDTAAIERFEAEADSSTVVVSKPSTEKVAPPKYKHPKSSPKHSKPAKSPKSSPALRRMDPVPQI